MKLTEEEGRLLDFIRERRRSYQLERNTEGLLNNAMLKDLAWFCRANETCVIPGDPDRTKVLEGRREVWLRIMQILNLSSEQQFALYANRFPNTGELNG